MPTADRWRTAPRRDPLDGVIDCPECRVHAVTSPHLLGSAASAGIEHGLSTSVVLVRYLDDYHQRGHRGRSGGGDDGG